jgi:hypothetical protein
MDNLIDKFLDFTIISLLVIAGLSCLVLIFGGVMFIWHFGLGGLVIAAPLLLIGGCMLPEIYSNLVRGI